MIQKSNDDGNIIEEGFEEADDDKIHRSSKTSIEDEANEEEGNAKPINMKILTTKFLIKKSNLNLLEVNIRLHIFWFVPLGNKC